MHIVDVTMFYAPHSGGVRRYLDAKRKWLFGRPNIDYSLLIPGETTTSELSIHYLPAPKLPLGDGYRFPLLPARWRERLVALSPDLIEVEDPYTLAWIALSVGAELSVPVVGFYHSDIKKLYGDRFGGLSTVLVGSYVSLLYKKFDLVFAPSPSVVDELRRLGVDNVALLPFGVDTELFHPARSQEGFKVQLGLSADTTLLTFVGRNAAEKNIPMLFEIMSYLDDTFHLLLIGPEMPDSNQPNVTVWSQYLEGLALSQALASADIFVHAGDCETFGLVIAEALASGTPVAGFSKGSVPYLVDESVGELAQVVSSEALAASVSQLAASNLAEKSLMARQRAVATLSWDRCFERLLNYYETLVGRASIKSGDQLSP